MLSETKLLRPFVFQMLWSSPNSSLLMVKKEIQIDKSPVLNYYVNNLAITRYIKRTFSETLLLYLFVLSG